MAGQVDKVIPLANQVGQGKAGRQRRARHLRKSLGQTDLCFPCPVGPGQAPGGVTSIRSATSVLREAAILPSGCTASTVWMRYRHPGLQQHVGYFRSPATGARAGDAHLGFQRASGTRLPQHPGSWLELGLHSQQQAQTMEAGSVSPRAHWVEAGGGRSQN